MGFQTTNFFNFTKQRHRTTLNPNRLILNAHKKLRDRKKFENSENYVRYTVYVHGYENFRKRFSKIRIFYYRSIPKTLENNIG